jgi:hypothetical protein
MHLVFGGELKSLNEVEFRDSNALDVVGLFADYARAVDAWREAAQRTVDDALMRYFIVPVHTPFDPNAVPSDRALARVSPAAE